MLYLVLVLVLICILHDVWLALGDIANGMECSCKNGRMDRFAFGKNMFKGEEIECGVSQSMGENVMEGGNAKPQPRMVSEYHIELAGLSQDGIPTGCESVSTVVALNDLGIEITPDEFIDRFLTCKNFWKENGITYGPNPYEVFAGNPYESGSLGCFSNVIVRALRSMQDAGYVGMPSKNIDNVTGTSLEILASTYVANDIPVIVWVTMGMEPSYDGMEYYLEDGNRYVWKAREHCMVLCGFDKEKYYLMDPLADGAIVGYEKWLVEIRYEELGREAVVVY